MLLKINNSRDPLLPNLDIMIYHQAHSSISNNYSYIITCASVINSGNTSQSSASTGSIFCTNISGCTNINAIQVLEVLRVLYTCILVEPVSMLIVLAGLSEIAEIIVKEAIVKLIVVVLMIVIVIIKLI